ncbi:MAG: metallophosphoesterase family protein [Alphaproteobacteria bacterium]
MSRLPFFTRTPHRAARFLSDRVGYAVGDIHGRDDLLANLLAEMEARSQADQRLAGAPLVVFLGDYVDRGPRAREVIDLLLSDRPNGFERRFLMGNHEQSMLAFVQEPLVNRAWVFHGGAETMRSYGVQPPPSVKAEDQAWLDAAAALQSALPPEHLAFLNGLERYLVMGDYLFVHAGVDLTKSLDDQTDTDLFWSRERFLKSKKPFSHRIVHGHTPADVAYVDPRRIGIDTGAYATGILTAVRLEGEEVDLITIQGQGQGL